MTEVQRLRQPHNIPIDGKYYGLKRWRAYELAEDYSYQWKKHDKHFRIFIKAGFKYDGASVPRFVWSITGIRPDGLIRAAALIHDWIYVYEGDLPAGSYQILVDDKWVNLDGKWTRKNADRIFARIMREAGVKKIRRRAAYRAVRLGGWIAWR